MLDLHDREWLAIPLSSVFSIKSTSSGIDKNKLIYQSGKYPYVTRTDTNNGINDFVCEQPFYGMDTGNCITVGLDTQTAFYQENSFYTGQNIQVLRNDKLNAVNAKFLVPLIKNTLSIFSWGGNGATLTRLRRSKIMLPVDESGNPDYAFMEQYIKEREQQIIQNYIDYIGDNVQIGEEGITPLNQKEWKEFFVEDVVTILPGRDIYDAERIPGKTPYVSSSSVNNGICHFVNNANDTLEANCISVNRNGSVGFAFYHPYEALFSNDCRKLRPKYKSNYISLFIATQITAQRNKYSYGYKMGTARLKRQKIMLPTTDNGTPDYDYMEQYVRQQIATLKLQYLQEKVTVAI